MEKGRPEQGAQGGSRGAPRAPDPPSHSPEGRWVGRSGALPSSSPQRPPGSPRSAGPPQRAPPPQSAGTHRPQRGALPPHALRDLSLALSAATPLPHPPPPASPPPFSASCSLSTSMIRTGDSPAAPRGSPAPVPRRPGRAHSKTPRSATLQHGARAVPVRGPAAPPAGGGATGRGQWAVPRQGWGRWVPREGAGPGGREGGAGKAAGKARSQRLPTDRQGPSAAALGVFSCRESSSRPRHADPRGWGTRSLPPCTPRPLRELLFFPPRFQAEAALPPPTLSPCSCKDVPVFLFSRSQIPG